MTVVLLALKIANVGAVTWTTIFLVLGVEIFFQLIQEAIKRA